MYAQSCTPTPLVRGPIGALLRSSASELSWNPLSYTTTGDAQTDNETQYVDIVASLRWWVDKELAAPGDGVERLRVCVQRGAWHAGDGGCGRGQVTKVWRSSVFDVDVAAVPGPTSPL